MYNLNTTIDLISSHIYTIGQQHNIYCRLAKRLGIFGIYGAIKMHFTYLITCLEQIRMTICEGVAMQ